MTVQDCLDNIFKKHDAECSRLTEQLKKTIIERDEARQQVCRQMLLRGVVFHRIGAASVAVTKESEVAAMMGWDCYKKEQ